MTPAASLVVPLPLREARAHWAARRDPAELDTLVLAIVAHHRPSRLQTPDALPENARLVADLGYDSLTLAEIVFFIEDLLEVSISTEDLKKISTIGDLRAYVRAKVALAA